LEVFPNPNDGSFRIHLPDNIKGEAEIRVYNAGGILVYHSTLHPQKGSQRLSLPEAENGMYIIRLVGRKGVYSKRIMIQH
jgi:hypothetical protein